MAAEYEVRRVPKVVVQSIKPGEMAPPMRANQYCFVVEHTKSGERYAEFDAEADAIAECERRNAQ
ncbi:hypothetical protein [Pseudomonas sp. S9]|uniref:hypothetical protein n=1 Tax=Pseudomonas sp. S9 TaxID=686578 RepID=UPI0002556DF2|nr:hypothetical protein [Pseudomonas sp. S9]